MTWDHLHDFVLVGGALFLLGFVAIGYSWPVSLIYRLLAGIAFVAFIVAIYFIAVWVL